VPRFEKSTGIKVSVGFRGDHPTLNRHPAELSEVAYDHRESFVVNRKSKEWGVNTERRKR